jgi:hypothetical protein
LSKQYTQLLSNIFSANEDFFSQTEFRALDANYQPDYQSELQLAIGTKGKKILTALKEKDSHILEVTLLIADEDHIPHTTVVKDFINQALGRALLGHYFAVPFIISAERTGISLFHRELDKNKTLLVSQLQTLGKNRLESPNFFDMINDNVSRYARPINEGIDFVRDIVDVHSKKKSPLIEEHPEFSKILTEIVGGDYIVMEDQIFFSFQKGGKNHLIPIYLASSSVKSLLELNFYLKCLAKKGDILLIDEPEQYLHPANQRKMARLFVRLMKAGIKILSPFYGCYPFLGIVSVLTMKKYQYTEEEVLDRFKVKAYSAEKRTLFGADIDEMGIEVAHFDKEIDEMNHLYNEMTVTLPFAYVD